MKIYTKQFTYDNKKNTFYLEHDDEKYFATLEPKPAVDLLAVLGPMPGQNGNVVYDEVSDVFYGYHPQSGRTLLYTSEKNHMNATSKIFELFEYDGIEYTLRPMTDEERANLAFPNGMPDTLVYIGEDFVIIHKFDGKVVRPNEKTATFWKIVARLDRRPLIR